ncbi:MAG: hypothetical protein IT184_06660 [Acidobacteria bacterium]|nr:hypothetical protein [Acidobacteriota bacterium]
MRTSKPYTNTTFTRRVDHEAGRHRPVQTGAGPQVCERCGAAYIKRRWVAAGVPQVESVKTLAAPKMVVCPACRMAADGRFAGEVRTGGAFLATHHADIEHLIRGEAGRAAEDNPMARILSMTFEAPDRLIVRTTTEHLAKRLGEALHKAYHGTVHYGFSHENKFAHVTWMRDE